MQRRTTETFKFTWACKGLTAKFISWPVFVPTLEKTNENLVIDGAETHEGLWNLGHYISMVLGEIVRLRDDENGYGPNGAGFIGHVEMPG